MYNHLLRSTDQLGMEANKCVEQPTAKWRLTATVGKYIECKYTQCKCTLQIHAMQAHKASTVQACLQGLQCREGLVSLPCWHMPAELTLELERQDLQRFLQPSANQVMPIYCVVDSGYDTQVSADICATSDAMHQCLQHWAVNRRHRTVTIWPFCANRPGQPHAAWRQSLYNTPLY